jgi:type IX secretion system PorP/SprF family membrane protein
MAKKTTYGWIARNLLCCIGFLLCSMEGWSQDPHFSQYFASPLTLNPANTGHFDYPARLAMNFRNQWQGVGEPYLTGTFSYDRQIFRVATGERNRFAAGLLGLYDQSAHGMYKRTDMGISLAYHQSLDDDLTSQLSVGFQANLAQRRLDPARLTFSDQFNGSGFDLSIPTAQRIQTTRIIYPDLNAGLMYTKNWENATLYLGTSAYHLTRPRESFLGDLSRWMDIRWTIHGGGVLWLGDQQQLMGSFQQMMQGNVSMQVVGLAYGRFWSGTDADVTIWAGAWYRHRDAIIPYIGYMYNNFQLGLSYDATISDLNMSSTRNRSMEVSMIYHFLDRSNYKRMVPWY